MSFSMQLVRKPTPALVVVVVGVGVQDPTTSTQ